LSSHKPIIGIAQSGSDLAPCNRHHLTLAKRVREGIRSAGGIAIEFPTHPIQETSRRPTATLDRNLSYLGLVELLHAYPFDGVVLLTGCDKTTPACTFWEIKHFHCETDKQLQVSWRLPRSTSLPYV
jgi:dihydroxy-acid dehydratase